MSFEDEYKPRIVADFLIVLAILGITRNTTVDDIFYSFIESGRFK